MSRSSQPRWWEMRRAQNKKPTTYRCPLCGELLPPLLPNALISPEGDLSRRRHAHLACVMKEREAGRMPTRDEYLKAQDAAAKTRAKAPSSHVAGEAEVDQTGLRGRRASASRIRWAFRPRLKRSRPSDS